MGSILMWFWRLLPVYDAVAERVKDARQEPAPPKPEPRPPLGNQRVSVGPGRPPPGLRH